MQATLQKFRYTAAPVDPSAPHMVEDLLNERLKLRAPRGEHYEMRLPNRRFMQLALLKAYYNRRQRFERPGFNLMISICSNVTGASSGIYGTVLDLKNALDQEMCVRDKQKALALLDELLKIWTSFRMTPGSVDELKRLRTKVAAMPENVGNTNYTLEREFWQALHAMSNN